MEEKYWSLRLCNYEGGEDEIIYFDNYDIAKKNFKALCKKGVDYDEFEADENSCSWFDPDYNEYSTYVTLDIRPLPMIHKDVIF